MVASDSLECNILIIDDEPAARYVNKLSLKYWKTGVMECGERTQHSNTPAICVY
jgi:hypothetical protein